jgi:Carboxypeptidase regulatory-like domain
MSRSIRFWRVVTAALLLAIGLSNGLAQTGAGRIQGTVTDPKGAAVPGAGVHIVKTSTNESFETTTNSVGFYSVPSLFAGPYSINITANGMSTWRTILTLQAGQTSVVDAHMVIGSVTSQVTVVGDQTTTINTENATQDTTVGRQQIEQIPQNGRSVAGILSATVPGYIGGSGNQPRVNGLVWGAFSWTQDGAPMDYRDGGGLDNVPPDPDTVQEVRVETSNSTALSDRPGYAIWSTKSGTNAIHGSAFETNRNNSYGIARNRQDSISQAAPKYIRNEYGISMGGPIIIPKLYNGRNKSFFFGSWEAMSLRQQQYKYYYVPTAAMKQGDFSGAFAPNGTRYTIYDSQTTTAGSASGSTVSGWQRTAFPNNQIPINRMSPLAKTLYAITPEPTNSDNPYTSPQGNWQGPQAMNQQQYDYTMRFDHHFSDQNTAFFRYSLGHRLQYAFNSKIGAQTTDGIWNGQFTPVDSQSGALSWTHISSPNFYQTVVVSMNYQSWKQAGSPGTVVNQDVASQLGLQNTFGGLGLPQIQGTNTDAASSSAQNSLLESYGQGSNPWRDSDYTNTFADNLTWIRGRHQIQFGAEYRHDQLRIQPDQARPEVVNFGGSGTANLNTASGTSFSAMPYTGLAAADFFLGNAQSYQIALSPHYLYMRDQETSIYVQDDFHVRPNLTLNLGLRYEALPALHEKYNQFTSFDYANAAIVTGHSVSQLIQEGRTTTQLVNGLQAVGVKFETPSQAGMPDGVFKNYYLNFLPRLGVAWMPLGDRAGLVVRGGYGVYAYKTPARNLYGGFNESVPYTYGYAQDYSNAVQNDGLANYILRSKQSVVAGQNSTNMINLDNQSAVCPGCFGYQTVASDLKPEGYREWNVTVQKSFQNHTALSVAYVANHGYNLEQLWNTNTAPSNYIWYMTTGTALPTGTYSRTATREYNKTTYGEIQQIRKTGWSNANMLQVSFHRLYYKGFEYNISYVYGKYFRTGGNYNRDSVAYLAPVFMPGSVPTDEHALNRFQTYLQDTAIPRNQIKYDWVVDLPVGQGKWLLSHANRVVNTILGGWQLAGTGNMTQWLFQPSASDYGTFSPLHNYGRKIKIMDCRGGNCHRAYLGYNGYLPASQINSANGVQGLPANYTPEHQPLNLTQNNQNLNITLANGSVVNNVPYALGPTNALNPNFHSFYPNPFNFSTDASLFKVFHIRESIGLKINGDFFNVFNQQGTNGVDGTTGIINTTSSFNTARIVQLSGRLTW